MIKINLNGKTVLITGGTRGIGKACVDILNQAGAEIMFTYNQNEVLAKKIIGECRPNSSKAVKISFENPVELEKDLAKHISDTNGIDILINNAGIWNYGEADSMSLEKWEETIRINLTSAFVVTKLCIPYMKNIRHGKIINISSTAGQRGEAFHSHYAASKGGIIAFTKSLASELGEYNINVNCVAPGWVLTDMTEEVFKDPVSKKEIEDSISLRRIASPLDIAGSVLFLASCFSDHITGEVLNVNGGAVLCG